MRKIAALLAAALSVGPLMVLVAAHLQSEEKTIVHVLNRLGFGPRPGDVEVVRTIGLQRYIELQLHPPPADNSGLSTPIARLTTVNMRPEELIRKYQAPLLEARREQQRQAAAGGQPEMAGRSPGPDPAQQQL